jgi:hypothetical protein
MQSFNPRVGLLARIATRGSRYDVEKFTIHCQVDDKFQIFTSEEVELPRDKVADFMESIDLSMCARYLEYIIGEREELSRYFHDRLAELYLRMILQSKGGRHMQSRLLSADGHKQLHGKRYIRSSSTFLNQINTIRSIAFSACCQLKVSKSSDHVTKGGLTLHTDLFEARAILLGKLGRHQLALELYVYRLKDYLKAEQ